MFYIEDDQAYKECKEFLSEQNPIDIIIRGFEITVGDIKINVPNKYKDLLSLNEPVSDRDYKIIRDESGLSEVYSYLEEYDYIAFDTETTGLNPRKNKVIGMSFSGKEDTGYYIPIFSWDDVKQELINEISTESFLKVLDALKGKKLLMWNASFDIRFVKRNFNVDLTDSLHCDVMLCKHTTNEDGTFRLKECAIEEQGVIGINAEESANKEQEELMGNLKSKGASVTKANFEMYKADLAIMGEYAAADADLTLRLFKLYNERLQEQGLSDFFYEKEVMPLYKYVTIPMEYSGINMDMDLLLETDREIKEELVRHKDMVVSELFKLKEVNNWLTDNLNKSYPAKASGRFIQEVVSHYNLDLPKTKSGKYSLSKPVIKKQYPNGLDCDGFRFLVGEGELDKDVITSIQKKLHLERNGVEINISSKKQLGEIVFNYLKIKPLSKTDKGNPQFNDTMIDKLESLGYEWARQLGNYNKLVKIKGSYIDRFLNAQEDGIFYPSFFQHRTISGRFGSDMQQLNRPKEEGELDPVVLKFNNIIRKFFISGEDRVFIDADYESLEPHVFAHVSGDEKLKDIFRKGHDFYSTVAIITENLEGVSADKKADNYLGKVNKPLRQKAKAYSLGIAYGMKEFALGKTLDIHTEDAKDLIEGYLNGFPDLRKWMVDSENKAKYEGYVTSETGRIRHLPKVKELFKKHRNKLLDFKYRMSLNKKYGKDQVLSAYRDYKNGLNNAKNVQIQGLSASIVNMAAIAINRELIKRGINGWVSLQVHDQLVVNVPKENDEECRVLVQDIMENNYKLSIDLKAPAVVAKDLFDGH